ncbi:helix-turn-helix transcriptional regulator [Flavobacterium sp. xlx-214]|uniref:helix-turn-helix domain-containing protein n=1 Tax=unclassified Flavobacterium TaxID=196869 RepID=UPI0013D1DA82|nr:MULTISPECIES: AraC family transcriptional regulator [unclassified Flavobacterium]MBA5791566.1 helix-turn-helix transcriptional regulator [Flavobacterium sp. xlx-221]QMI82815.1 helix-turn-helix transcriptional regulator [Flavobacterium sp. xlx-214]
MKKNIIFSQERWNNLQESLLTLAQGNLSKKIKVKYLNDDLESIEVLLNMVIDEWKQRVLQMPFNKPETHKFIHHYQLLLNKNLQILDVDQQFPLDSTIDIKNILNKKITQLLEEEDQNSLEHYINQLNYSVNFHPETPSITVLGNSYLYSIKKLSSGKNYILNLYQIHLDTKYFSKGLASESTEMIKLEQRKRYRDIIEEIKEHIDQLPLSERLQLKQICKSFGINSFQLKKGFQELYQCCPYDYFLTLRMKHAHLLVETSTISLKELSQMVGYSQYPTFSTQFLKTFQIRPRTLRKKQQNNI